MILIPRQRANLFYQFTRNLSKIPKEQGEMASSLEEVKRQDDAAAPIAKEASKVVFLASKEHSQIYQEIRLKDDLNLFIKHSKELLFKEVSIAAEKRDRIWVDKRLEKQLIC